MTVDTLKFEICPCCKKPILSAQRRWQLRKVAQGLCSKCGKRPLKKGELCEHCAQN